MDYQDDKHYQEHHASKFQLEHEKNSTMGDQKQAQSKT